MKYRYQLMAFAAVAFFFGALLLVTQEITVVLDGGKAAWVQAIGSVGAILVAVWISRREHRRAEKYFTAQRDADNLERARKARNLALALYPELLEMKAKLEGANVEAMLTLHATIEIPPVLIESVDRLYMLGSAGDEIQQFLAIVRQLYRMIAAARGKPGRPEALGPHLDLSKVALDRAIELIGPIQDTPV